MTNDKGQPLSGDETPCPLNQGLLSIPNEDCDDEENEISRRSVSIIAGLRAEVELLRKSSSDLRRRADDLRDKNIGLAKRLAQREERAKYTAACSEKSSDENEKPVRGGTDAYGRRVTDLRAANEALERLVHAKDAEIENLSGAQKVGEEIISILRYQAAALREEKRSRDDDDAAEAEELLRGRLAKSERKNAALKRSLEGCMEELECVKSRLDRAAFQQQQASDDKSKKSRWQGQDQEEDEIVRLRAEMDNQRAQSRDVIAQLWQKLRDAEENLRRSRTFRSAAASVMALELREATQNSERVVSELEGRLRESDLRAAKLEEENALLRRKVSLHSNPQEAERHLGVPSQKDEESGSNTDCSSASVPSSSSVTGPLMKHVAFVLQMKDKALSDMKSERDEARDQVERLRAELAANRTAAPQQQADRLPVAVACDEKLPQQQKAQLHDLMIMLQRNRLFVPFQQSGGEKEGHVAPPVFGKAASPVFGKAA